MPTTQHALWSAGKPKQQRHWRSSLFAWERFCRHIRSVAVVAFVTLWLWRRRLRWLSHGCKMSIWQLRQQVSCHPLTSRLTTGNYLAVIFIIIIYFLYYFRLSLLSNSSLLLNSKFLFDCWRLFYIFYRDFDEPKVCLDKYYYKCSILLLCVVLCLCTRYEQVRQH